jgi:hypothetical protein
MPAYIHFAVNRKFGVSSPDEVFCTGLRNDIFLFNPGVLLALRNPHLIRLFLSQAAVLTTSAGVFLRKPMPDIN